MTEIRYGYGQSEEAIALLDYIPDAKLVPDPAAKDSVQLVLGSSYPGTITVPHHDCAPDDAPGHARHHRAAVDHHHLGSRSI